MSDAVVGIIERGPRGPIGPAVDLAPLTTRVTTLESTVATDSELASAVATLTTAINLKQNASTAATDTELAAAQAVLDAAIDAVETAVALLPTDSEVAASISAAIATHASGDASDAELAAAVALEVTNRDAAIAAAVAAHAAGDATDAELTAAISSEVSSRNTAISSAVAAEASTRAAADTALDGRLDVVEPLVDSIFPVTAGRIAAFGPSYINQDTLAQLKASEMFIPRLASLLGAEEVNYGVSGCVLAADDSIPTGVTVTGGIVTALTKLIGQGSPSYLPFSDLVIAYYGPNDVFRLDASTAVSLRYYKHALRSLVAAALSGRRWAYNDAAIAYTGTWSNVTDATKYPTGSVKRTSTNGDSFTFTAPADMPTGDLAVYFAVNTTTGKIDFTVNGVAAGSLDLRNADAAASSSSKGNVACKVLANVPAGASVVGTISAMEASGQVNVSGITVRALTPPLVVLPNWPDLPASFVLGGVAHSPLTNADMAAINTVHDEIAAEFGAQVVIADVKADFAAASASAASGAPGTAFCTDNLHLLPYGHALVAKAVMKTLRVNARKIPVSISTGRPRSVGGYQEPTLQNSYTAGAVAPAFVKRHGRVTLQGIFVKATPVASETIFTLPPGCRPSSVRTLFGVGTGNVIAVMYAQTDGRITWQAGAASSGLDLASCSFLADGN